MKNVLSNKKRIKVWGAETKRGTLAVRLVIALRTYTTTGAESSAGSISIYSIHTRIINA
jgi:hypothetical protein